MGLDGAVERVHGTAIALLVDGVARAALIRGPSGAGKSDLALRCLATGPTALLPWPVRLVADDQVVVTRRGDRPMASAPESIAGLIEVRGLGVVRFDPLAEARLVMLVDLVAAGMIERLPDPVPSDILLGVALPVLQLHAFDCSSAVKLLIGLAGVEL